MRSDVDTPLSRWIRTRIETDGPVPFERFMAWALTHPDHGYYTSGTAAIGTDAGDFTTAPHLSAVFGRCLARWLSAADRALGRPDPFWLFEGGPGEGVLAREILDTLRTREPNLYRRLRYSADETSPILAGRQAERLRPHRDRVFPEGGRGHGVYLSNELLDALPVHRIRVDGDGTMEACHVTWGGGGFREVWLPPPPEVAALARAQGALPGPGWEAEVRPGIAPWLGRVVARLERGYVVTIDYGDTAERLYGPHRPAGTCAAYRGHRLSEDLLAAPGLQDLTAHVNFTAVVRAGREHGVAAGPLLAQTVFLFAAGLADETASLERDLAGPDLVAARQELHQLLLPGTGMGEAFRVLVQAVRAPLDAVPLEPDPGAWGSG